MADISNENINCIFCNIAKYLSPAKIIFENDLFVSFLSIYPNTEGVNHLHAKLFPLHGTSHVKETWQAINSEKNEYFDRYQGSISTHDCNKVTNEKLEITHQKIKKSIQIYKDKAGK